MDQLEKSMPAKKKALKQTNKSKKKTVTRLINHIKTL
jgi:hypothetical protein